MKKEGIEGIIMARLVHNFSSMGNHKRGHWRSKKGKEGKE